MWDDLIYYFFIYYILLINIITFGLFAWDKRQAMLKGWRISENQLLMCGFIGGALGGIISMYLFRHKVKRLKFSLGMIFLLCLQIILFGFFYF